MHIVFLTSEYPKEGYPHGGIGTFVYTISHQLIKRGVEVSIVGINYESKDEYEEDHGIKIYRQKKSWKKGIAWFKNSQAINKKLNEVNEESKIDVIDGSELSYAFLTKIEGVKYVIRLHGGHHFFSESEKRSINWRKGFQEKKSFKKADAFIGVSNYVVNHTAKYLSYENKKIEVIRYPINTELFKPQEGSIVESKSIIFAGTLCKKKGIFELLKAFEKINTKHPESKLKLYGRDQVKNGISYIGELQKNHPDLFRNVYIMGSVKHDKLPKVYSEAEVCVFPSYMETQGLVAPEAMACGRPVVFSNKGPGPETIVDKVTGRLCNPHDPNDIAEKILWLFENKDAIPEMTKKAREFVQENFGLDTCAENNIRFYKTLLSN